MGCIGVCLVLGFGFCEVRWEIEVRGLVVFLKLDSIGCFVVYVSFFFLEGKAGVIFGLEVLVRYSWFVFFFVIGDGVVVVRD